MPRKTRTKKKLKKLTKFYGGRKGSGKKAESMIEEIYSY